MIFGNKYNYKNKMCIKLIDVKQYAIDHNHNRKYLIINLPIIEYLNSIIIVQSRRNDK